MRAPRFGLVALLALAACGGESDAAAPRSGATPLSAALAAPSAAAAQALRSGRLGVARSQLEQSLAQDPEGMAALNDLAVAYAVEERFEAARHLLDEVLSNGSPREQQLALVNLGELYALDGYLTAAQAHLASATAIDPGRPEPWYAMALLADGQGDRAGAQAALRQALEADPGGAARRDLAFVYPEERLHLEAIVAEASGDTAGASSRWRELARGRFPSLAQAAQRHLEEP